MIKAMKGYKGVVPGQARPEVGTWSACRGVCSAVSISLHITAWYHRHRWLPQCAAKWCTACNGIRLPWTAYHV